MAELLRKVYLDDIDAKTGQATEDDPTVQTVVFSIDNRYYQIDLNQTHRDELEQDLRKWIKHARRVASPAGVTTTKGRKRTRIVTDNEIRQWAMDQGFDVPDRGRIRREFREAYDAAH